MRDLETPLPMRYLSRIFLLAVMIILAGCAESYWPGDATPKGENFADDVISARYDEASKKILGTAKDELEINNLLQQNMPHYKVSEIRWISPTKVLALVECHKPYASLFCALEKNGWKWRFVTSYLGTVE